MGANEAETLEDLSARLTRGSEGASSRDLEYLWQPPSAKASLVPATLSLLNDPDVERDDVVSQWRSETIFELTGRGLKKWRQRADVSASTSPFGFASQELPPSSSFETLTTYLKYGLNREDGERLASRLEELRGDLSEEGDEASELSINSVLGLFRFFEENPEVRDPALVAAAKGTIRAEWHRTWNEHFVVEFITDTLAKFVVITRNANEVEHLSGRCAVESVMDRATPFGIRRWVVKD